MRIAYFGHDSADAVIRKRVRNLEANGHTVQSFTHRRHDNAGPEWDNVDLGRTRNGAYLDRIISVFRGAFRTAKHKDALAKTDLIIARNLDLLIVAFLAKRLTGLSTPVIYECLDVHRQLCRQDAIGWVARKIEGSLLKRCRGLLVSSPAFLKEHFERYYKGEYRAALIENRLPEAFAETYQRPDPDRESDLEKSRPLRLGWVGILRCQRTLDLMVRTAHDLGDAIEIHVHGKPDLWNVPKFHETVETVENIVFHGAYKAPEQLPDIYNNLDLIWSGDFMEAGLNSTWLLPNRIYEGGYLGVPAITPEGTQTANWVENHRSGFVVAEPIEESVPVMLRKLGENRHEIQASRQSISELPDAVFIEPRLFLCETLERLLDRETPSPATPTMMAHGLDKA